MNATDGDRDRFDGEPSTTVEAPAEPRPAADTDASAGSLDLARLPGTDEGRNDVIGPRRDVARLEDVLTVDHRDRIAPRTAAAAAPVVEPAQADGHDTVSHTKDDALERAKRELARLEDALAATAAKTAAASPAVESAPETTQDSAVDMSAAPPEEARTAAPVQARAIAPSYLAAHALRAAFLYEQTSAFEQASSVDPEDKPDSIPPPVPQAVAPEAETNSTSEPDRSGIAEPDESSPSVVRLWWGHASRNNWLAALCLLSLIVMVVVLTGHAPRRLAGGKAG